MGRRSNAQIEMEKNMAESNDKTMMQTEEDKDWGETIVADTLVTSSKTETDKRPIVGQRRQFSYTEPSQTPLREMRLSTEQKDMLIRNELTNILDIKNTREMEGGTIPVFIDYPLSDDSFEVATAFIKKDYRLVQSAWDYYKENADNPTVRKFVLLVSEIIKQDAIYRRIHHLRLN